ncbi:molybdopterin-binding protein [Oceanidesulfovibrio indonesiensis]|uniref:Molybdopterin molybdenumtransferase n=1 Tax=Oceanidesulfovibrio indonesiensis TaxID=54767 RepID=A0A7M3MCU1_9BACT|nr:molybdopterin-binding protein [Oceanidesulfovibrio indonesiensis]TVM16334.1 molybdopterin-binding protein [Oceanidesulfovibrio indonesiensis]
MKSIPVQEAVGSVLCHDITQIVPGEFKGRAFKRGHIIRSEDVATLLNLGKEHIYVFDLAEGYVHEDDAAVRIATAVAGNGIILSETSEGRVNLFADIDGLVRVNAKALHAMNAVDEIVIATIHNNQQVHKGRPLAGARVVPLAVREEKVRHIEAICRSNAPIVTVLPFQHLHVGVVTTGSEVYHGRIKDRFGPVIRRKFGELGCSIIDQVFVPDDVDMTVSAINDLLKRGASMIAVTGGMSVDPDDRTPSAIRAAGGQVVTYGAPTFPGAMFMLAYLGNVPVVGLPGCVMYARSSIFDLVVPRIVAGEVVTREDIVALGHGGYCAGCAECRYPNCAFGKGA